MSQSYFLKRADSVRGPFSLAKMQTLLTENKIKRNDLIAVDRKGPWKRLRVVHKDIQAGIPPVFDTETKDHADESIDPEFDLSHIAELEAESESLGEMALQRIKRMERFSETQRGLRERATRVARKLDTNSVRGRRLQLALRLLDLIESDLKNNKFNDAFRKQKVVQRHIRNAELEAQGESLSEDDEPTDVDDKLRDSESSVADSIWSIIGGTVGLAFVAGVVFVIYRFGSTLIAIFGGDSTEMLGFDLTLHGFFYGMAVLGGAMIGSVFTWFGFLVMLVEKDSDNQTGTGCLAFLLFGGVFLFIIGLCGGAIF